MTVKQISVFVENKIGNLAKVTEVLARAGVSLYAISLAETKDFGIMRIIADDSYEAAQALKREGYIFSITEVLVAELADRPGSLFEALTVLQENGIDLKYLYDFNTATTNNAYMVFRVEDNGAAAGAFRRAGLRLLGQEDLKKK